MCSSDLGEVFTDHLNPHSRQTSTGYLEPALADADDDRPVQFLRMGYFVRDRDAEQGGMPVFNRAVTLKDSWARVLRNRRENE